MKHIKALFAWVLVLTFLCVGCKVQPLSMRTGGESAAIGAQPTFEDLAAEERTVADGELFRAQFEGTAVEGSAGVVDGKYRITTIEGNVKGHTVRMYVRDYDLNMASDKKLKQKDMTLVPKEERDRDENTLFSYGYAYTKKNMYITIFLMPWIPEETAAE